MCGFGDRVIEAFDSIAEEIGHPDWDIDTLWYRSDGGTDEQKTAQILATTVGNANTVEDIQEAGAAVFAWGAQDEKNWPLYAAAGRLLREKSELLHGEDVVVEDADLLTEGQVRRALDRAVYGDLGKIPTILDKDVIAV